MDNGLFILKGYGCVTITIRDEMEKQGITRNRLSKLTGIVYNTINRYYHGNTVSADLDILAKICYVLQCDIGDILRYEAPV